LHQLGCIPDQDLNDVMTQPVRTGGDGADSDPDIFAKLYKNVFGAKISLPRVFAARQKSRWRCSAAKSMGSAAFRGPRSKSHYGSWVKDKKINVLLQAGVKKEPDLPNVPLADDFARTKEQRQILDFVLASQIMALPFAAPPDIPAGRKAILRSGFDETMKDPVFLADAAKIQLDVDPVSGRDVDALVANFYATPKDVVAKPRARSPIEHGPGRLL